MVSAAVFDLDGVIRHFDPAVAAEVAARHGLTVRALYAAAFEPALLRRLVTGGLTRAAWTEHVGDRLGASAAALEWLEDIGRVDPEVLGLIREVRAAGAKVAIFTNGTDRIDVELETLGVRSEVDLVVNTWHLGVAKPDAEAYARACAALGVRHAQVFFTDDRVENVDAALALGMRAHLFEGAAGLRGALEGLGLLLS